MVAVLVEVVETTTMDVDRMATSNLLEVSHQMDQTMMTEMEETMDQMDQAVLTGRRLLADPEDLVDLADRTDLVDLEDRVAQAIPMDQGGLSDIAIEHALGMDVKGDADTRSRMMECPAIAVIMEPPLSQSTMLGPHKATQQMT